MTSARNDETIVRMAHAGMLLAACLAAACGPQPLTPAKPRDTAARGAASLDRGARPVRDAEYAVRWDPRKGGPKSPAAVVAALQDEPDGDAKKFEVRYFDLKAPADAPAGSTAILRRRVRKAKNKHELTFKYRSDEPLRDPRCALPNAENKDEVDVTILGSLEPRRVYSFSCEVESTTGPVAPPAVLEARLKPCRSTMTRLEAERSKVKVEEWRLPKGDRMLEVSLVAHDTNADLAAFKDEIVEVLIDAGIRPVDRSKTQLGSDCP